MKAYNDFLAKNNENLVEMNDRRSKLQKLLDDCQIETKKAETEWIHIQETAAAKTIKIGNMRMAIRNLYQVALKHKNREDTPELSHDTENQLKLIKEFMQDLTSITTELSRTEGNYNLPSSI
jgi:DNA repair ATPase RecN